MEKEVKYWILLGVSNASRRTGVDAVKLFYEKQSPSFTFDFNQLRDYLEELTRGGLLQKIDRPITSFILTAEGIKILRKLNKEDPPLYFKLVKFFPDIELKERIINLEAFVFGAVILVTGFLINQKYSDLKSFFLITGFVVSAYYFLNIAVLIVENFQIAVLKWVSDFIEQNKYWLGYAVVIGLNILLFIFMPRYFETTRKQILAFYILEGVFMTCVNFKRIVTFFKEFKGFDR